MQPRYSAGRGDILGIPIIPKPYFSHEEVQNLRLLGFDQIKRDEGRYRNRMVHFFLYDYKFEKIWEDPKLFVELLRPYRAVLTPDFSMYTEIEGNIIYVDYNLSSWQHMEDDIVPAELVKHT